MPEKERMRVLVNSCIREMDRIWMRGRREMQERRHAVSKINRAVSRKTAIEDSKRCNIPAVRKAEDRQSRRIDKTKSF